METERPWHEDERFWEAFRDAMFPAERFADARDELDSVLALPGVDVSPGDAVLDLPCGPGRHSVALADSGFDVTGVDATAAYVEEARERAADRGVAEAVEFVEADMREFRRDGAFDLALNLFTSFGYFEDRADDARVARNLHDVLAPGGTLVMDLASKETLASDFRARTWEDFDDGYVLEEHAVADDWSWMENTWRLVVDGDVREFDVSHRLYSAYELTELLADAGFDGVEAYGTLDGDPFDQDAERLLVVARA
ncbi:class I SAM-dependent methyltransferase [Halorubellus sp. JP-L1]|uniref:SAM-dependent methyltransferase n=1 Tax=Halorubellus sp. JP-L1 TaxID=2715753 RepID=UPI001409B850|nr:class I SAM-dependent methyltransferase [Halorubellus sp. JP-L1]NHN43020.1 class I SAM-dependent methyltransferase [Halorubellus sp. JP-L1]